MAGAIFGAPVVMSLFFQPPPEDEDPEIFDRTREITASLEKSGAGTVKVLLCRDTLPVLLSLSHPGGKKILALSTGLVELTEGEQLNLLIRREAVLLSRPDAWLFTAAGFLPFVAGAASAWFFESSRQLQAGRRPGTSHLAGVILSGFGNLLLLPLSPVARLRHHQADEEAAPEESDRQKLSDALDKISRHFLPPVEEGAPFRKRIYQAMEMFLPFSPTFNRDVELWRNFIGEKDAPPSIEVGKQIEAENCYFSRWGWTRCHPPLGRRFLNSQNKPPAGCQTITKLLNSSCQDLFMNLAPAGFLSLGLFLSLSVRRLFGLPFILTGIALVARAAHFSSSKSIPEKPEVNKPFNAKGDVAGFLITGRLDGDHMFLQTRDRIIPLVLKQFSRTDESLLPLIGSQVKVQGDLRVERFPYLELNVITPLNEKKPRSIRSAHRILQVLLGLAMLLAGVLILMLEFSPHH